MPIIWEYIIFPYTVALSFQSECKKICRFYTVTETIVKVSLGELEILWNIYFALRDRTRFLTNYISRSP